MEKEKENTARIVLFRELESTFYGSDSLGKTVYEDNSQSSSDSETIAEDNIKEENQEENKDKLDIIKNSKSEPVEQTQNIEFRNTNNEDTTDEGISIANLQSNRFEIKLPLLVPAKLEKRTLINTKHRKSKIIGDIHVKTEDLNEVGADL